MVLGVEQHVLCTLAGGDVDELEARVADHAVTRDRSQRRGEARGRGEAGHVVVGRRPALGEGEGEATRAVVSAVEERDERAPVEIAGRRDPGERVEGGREIDVAHDRVHAEPRERRPRLRAPRIEDHERDVRALVAEEQGLVAVAASAVEQPLAALGGHDDDRVAGEVLVRERAEQAPDAVIDGAHGAVVERAELRDVVRVGRRGELGPEVAVRAAVGAIRVLCSIRRGHGVGRRRRGERDGEEERAPFEDVQRARGVVGEEARIAGLGEAAHRGEEAAPGARGEQREQRGLRGEPRVARRGGRSVGLGEAEIEAAEDGALIGGGARDVAGAREVGGERVEIAREIFGGRLGAADAVVMRIAAGEESDPRREALGAGGVGARERGAARGERRERRGDARGEAIGAKALDDDEEDAGLAGRRC
ncbi:MAG TPA: hypothetical protein VLT33_07975 [Labilithrix sp.]|nr:hypothetical protein [Labilithrix sp.]